MAPRLQISVIGDYGRMERRSNMGIAQIRLDDLPLSSNQQIEGVYKLFHNSSLAATAPPAGVSGLTSENSLMEM